MAKFCVDLLYEKELRFIHWSMQRFLLGIETVILHHHITLKYINSGGQIRIIWAC